MTTFRYPGLERQPLVMINNLLTGSQKTLLFESILHLERAFSSPGEQNLQQQSCVYLELDSPLSEVPSDSALIKALNELKQTITRLLPALFSELELIPFTVPNIKFSIANGRNGHYGLPHNDTCEGRYQLSLLYYLHKHPKPFEGGQLQLFSDDESSHMLDDTFAKATISPCDNTLLAFRSETFHGVTEVVSESDEFSDGRFVIIAFIGR
ncbi:2OG-Fe(II) oxygenase [Vibrio sp. 10N]|uniref:2OG-Fe(II) oxygenase n=1 Tax=Vibrio sp. 10N TaxID=3058938 RepID=UPI0030C67DEF